MGKSQAELNQMDLDALRLVQKQEVKLNHLRQTMVYLSTQRVEIENQIVAKQAKLKETEGAVATHQ